MRPLALAAVLLLLAAGCSSGKAGGLPRPASDFSATVDNPWFPLTPGTRFVYRGVKDGEQAREVVTVTSRTKTIRGAKCVVLRDVLYLSGRLHERTEDWYTQDRDGNVWYFGEATAELDRRGHVTSTEGSWEAGRDGAQPGIFIPNHPRVGATFRQEYYKGHAEDHFRVVSLHEPVRVPYVGSKVGMLTREWTPLEPDVIDFKVYVRGTGLVKERAANGRERLELIAVRRS